jgi:hypothetical protein
MTELPLDFDSILAYLIPGFVAVAGLSFLSPNLQRLFRELGSQHSASTLLLLTIVALVAGILLSDVRVATLQRTCGIDLKWIPLKWIRCEPSFASIPSEPVAYGKLIEEGRLKAFQEAKRSEQTPYRFHGNTLLAVTVFVLARLIALSKVSRATISKRARIRGIVAAIFLFLISITILYPSFRTHYYNFTNAVRAINQLTWRCSVTAPSITALIPRAFGRIAPSNSINAVSLSSACTT